MVINFVVNPHLLLQLSQPNDSAECVLLKLFKCLITEVDFLLRFQVQQLAPINVKKHPDIGSFLILPVMFFHKNTRRVDLSQHCASHFVEISHYVEVQSSYCLCLQNGLGFFTKL